MDSLLEVAEAINNVANAIDRLAESMPVLPLDNGKAIVHLVELFHHEFPTHLTIHDAEEE